MDPIRRSPWSIAGSAAALLLVALLGNLRLSASEVRTLSVADRVGPDVAFTTAANERSADADVDGESVVGSGDVAAAGLVGDEERLVPAIYAWDPDVRFVYYRHVSKWM